MVEITEDLMQTFTGQEESQTAHDTPKKLTPKNIDSKLTQLEKAMKSAAKDLNFEEAARLRDEIKYYKTLQLLEDY